MHIVMLAGEYPPRWGGMATTIYHLTAELASCGHKVTVITRKEQEMHRPSQAFASLACLGSSTHGVHALLWPPCLAGAASASCRRSGRRRSRHTPLIAWTRGQFDRCHREVAPTVTTLHGSWIGEREGLLMARRRREPQRLRTRTTGHPPHGQGLRALRTSRAREEHLCGHLRLQPSGVHRRLSAA